MYLLNLFKDYCLHVTISQLTLLSLTEHVLALPSSLVNIALYLSRDSRKQSKEGGLMKIMKGFISDVRRYRKA